MTKCLFLAFLLFAIPICRTQNISQIRKIKPDKAYENVLSKALNSDSLASSFKIWVKDTVAEHKHAFHSEHIYVLKGKARMYLNGKISEIEAGDVIFVPQNTWHAVKTTSRKPLEVLSIQAPYFDGKDRVMKGK